MKNVIELLENKGIAAKKVSGNKGGEYHSPCPGCGGDDRFHVWPEQNSGEGSWWCRQCGQGGDNIQFLIEFDMLDFKSACRALEKDLQPDIFRRPKLPPQARAETFQPVVTAGPVQTWQEKAGKFIDWCHQNLLESRKYRKRLHERGLEPKTWQKFRLGWNPGKDGRDLFRPREAWGLETELKDDGRKKRLWLPAGMSIPLLADNGHDVRRIRIRRDGGRPPPYYVIPGSGMECLRINPDCRLLVVVESELDAILLDQEAGDVAGCVALGNASRKPDAATAVALQKAALVLVALDHDQAGHQPLCWWQDQYPHTRHWPVPVGKDPGEAHLQGINLKDWITAAYPPAWQVEQSLLGSRPRDQPVVEDKAAQPSNVVLPQTEEVPEAVRELAALLGEHPVRLYVSNRRTTIHEARGWAAKNWEISKRISKLVYFTAEVFDWLEAHPAEVIDGGNIIQDERKNRKTE